MNQPTDNLSEFSISHQPSAISNRHQQSASAIDIMISSSIQQQHSAAALAISTQHQQLSAISTQHQHEHLHQYQHHSASPKESPASGGIKGVSVDDKQPLRTTKRVYGP
jgi:hypothetical protein